MSEVRVNNLSNESLSGGPTISGITTFSSPYFFVPPKGDTASRPQSCPSGSLRFNTDSSKLEYYKGDTIGWVEIEATNDELGGGTGSNTGLGTRMLISGGFGSPSDTNVIQFVTISTLGNSQDFGDLIDDRYTQAACSSRTRFVAMGGFKVPNTLTNVIQFNTFASLGNAQDFGDMTDTRAQHDALSNQTRGVFTFGGTPVANTLEYITIASTGNSVDFADATDGGRKNLFSCASTTRGLFVGGRDGSNNYEINIDQITINTQANAVDFGDLVEARAFASGFSNSTRGLFAAGRTPNGFTNIIEQVTIATQGNATDFGGDTIDAFNYTSGAASPTRGVIAGGVNDTPSSDTYYNVIQKVEILSSGNAVDFGDLLATLNGTASASNGHGGL